MNENASTRIITETVLANCASWGSWDALDADRLISDLQMVFDQRAAPRTFDELHALLPNAAIESVGEREELVIYTGLTDIGDGTLVEMIEEGDGDDG